MLLSFCLFPSVLKSPEHDLKPASQVTWNQYSPVQWRQINQPGSFNPQESSSTAPAPWPLTRTACLTTQFSFYFYQHGLVTSYPGVFSLCARRIYHEHMWALILWSSLSQYKSQSDSLCVLFLFLCRLSLCYKHTRRWI